MTLRSARHFGCVWFLELEVDTGREDSSFLRTPECLVLVVCELQPVQLCVAERSLA
ncbi:MAG: hypothetical protein ACKO3T_20105 [Planctomycetaceae bacterium]